MPDKYVIAKALLAMLLGPIAITGALILKNPDGNHFVGDLRDRLRVERAFDQVDILVKAIRQLVLQQPSSATSDFMLELTQKPIIPGRMIGATPKGLVILSPWNTEITTANEREAFGITVPMSQLGCLKALALLSASRYSDVSVDGQRLKLPINNESAVKNCRGGRPIPEVTLWFPFVAAGKL